MIFVFLKAISLGFLIGAAIGPIAMLCIRRTLVDGYRIGLATGLGAAVADATFAGIAAFGITAISDFLLQYDTILRIGGGIYLMYLGLRAYNAKIRWKEESEHISIKTGTAFISTFFLTLTSPLTICAFALLFMNAQFDVQHFFTPFLVVLGAFCGSAIWWIILTALSYFFRKKLNITLLKVINKASGVIITFFGIASLFSVFLPFLKKCYFIG